MRLRPVDAPRERPAPTGYTGVDARGRSVQVRFSRPSVVIAVKPGCDGCREFLDSSPTILGLDVHVVAEREDPAWALAATSVVVSPELWRDLQILSAPYFVLVDPLATCVVGEGSVFSLSQVLDEVARQLED